jgi:hypothetical protein
MYMQPKNRLSASFTVETNKVANISTYDEENHIYTINNLNSGVSSQTGL